MRLLLLLISSFFAIPAFSQSSEAPVEVDVVYPNQSQSISTITLSGTVEAKQHAELAALEAGMIDEILVEVGDEVEAGQTLIRLNADLAELSLQSAKASAKVAEINLAEAKRLYEEVLALSKRQVVAQTLIAERAALVANAEAEIARTQANTRLQQEIVKRHELMAPFTGVIATREVDVGEWISQQNQVLSLVDQQHLRLSIQVPQQYYGLLSKSMNSEVGDTSIDHEKVTLTDTTDIKVLVRPDINSLAPIAAKISRLVPVSNSVSRTFLAQIDLPSQLDWVAGISAIADIQIPNSTTDTIVLPIAAVKQHPDGGSSVFVLKDGKAKRVITPYVNLLNGKVSISGLPADVPYIVSGVEVLRDGIAVAGNDVSSAQL